MYQHASGALLAAFADDLFLACPVHAWEEIRRDLEARLTLKWSPELGPTRSRYLGRLWRRQADGSWQVRLPEAYWSDILEEVGLASARAARTPGDPQRKADETPALGPEEHALYRRIVGKLLWAASIRVDLAYITKELARQVQSPSYSDWMRLRRVLRYVRGTQDYVLQLTGHEEPLEQQVLVYSDADYAMSADRKSTSGGVVFFQGVILTTWSRTQPVVALSTAESELVAMSSAAQEGLLVRHVLEELGERPILRLLTDSSSARAIVWRRGVGKVKHMQVRWLWLQDALREGELQCDSVTTAANLADIFTKCLGAARHEALTAALGLASCPLEVHEDRA